MLLEVKREPSAAACTLGSLYVDGEFECFTLEDVVREVPMLAVEKWKVPDETAIPSGTYEVIVDESAHFQKLLPLLLKVPGFEGVRIHSGNVAADTEGCILVGKRRTANAVLASRAAFNALFGKIKTAIAEGQTVRVRITNPPLLTSAREVAVV
ncbi:MAG: DUF5675 family protein [Terriglobales bacterium]